MKTIFNFALLCFIFNMFLGCDSKEDCKKMMLIPQGYFVGTQFYTYDVLKEVSCDFPAPLEVTIIDPIALENFTYEVIFFRYSIDLINNKTRLEFQIKLNNPNDYVVKGVPVLTTASQGLEFRGEGYSVDASNPCYGIDAKSSCILTYDKQFPINFDIGYAENITLVNVEYFITN